MLPLSLPKWRDLGAGLLHLIYPNLCVGCDRELSGDYCFCLICRRQLHETKQYLEPENDFTERFWGRLQVESGAAMYYFNRKSPVQRALHQLKYKNQADVGVRIGRRFGRLLARTPHFADVEAIVPVPLHSSRERRRGYNQSAIFAQGLSESIRRPVLENVLARVQQTTTQTRKKRMERFQNVGTVFALKRPDRIRGKHLLLVDDVLTTGATLEACGSLLLSVDGVRLSMVTIAMAVQGV
ncbi:MAG: ComF family protein [Bacteroidetes bacterium]|nr:MAG: ComF family protein [Bacteroidota bacterium]